MSKLPWFSVREKSDFEKAGRLCKIIRFIKAVEI